MGRHAESLVQATQIVRNIPVDGVTLAIYAKTITGMLFVLSRMVIFVQVVSPRFAFPQVVQPATPLIQLNQLAQEM
jgi:hypothetical protein